MPEATRATAVRWPVPLALAVPALAAAVAVTFSAGHSSTFGYLVFAGFALLTAAAAVVGITMLPDGPSRAGAIAKTVVAAVGAIAALLLLVLTAFTPVSGELPIGGGGAAGTASALGLSLTIAATFALFGAIDLVVGIRQRRSDRFGRDWIVTGVIELVGALVVVVVPPTFYQAFSFTEKTGELVSGVVTSSTMIVGLFGAATAVLGVFLAISGIGLVPQRAPRERATA